MPNSKSAKKRLVTSDKKRVLNLAFKSKLRTFVLKLKTAVSENNKEQAQQLLPQVYSLYDKAVKKGIVKSNNAARHKAALSLKVNSL